MPTAEKTLAGIHHVTAITADAQKNIDFYCGVLGLRLVKLTVNFDDPGSYHLYYGDELGRPGTIMTFFAWGGAYRGRIGPPQVSVTAFAVPTTAMSYWSKRLEELRVPTQAEDAAEHFGEPCLSFADPDGMRLEIVGSSAPQGQPWAAGPVPVEHAIRGFHGVTIAEEGYENTAKLLTDVMGFKAIASEKNRYRYRAAAGSSAGSSAGTSQPEGGPGFANIVDILCVPGAPHGALGAGVVHHIAFRTPDDAQQKAWHHEIARLGFNISPVMDRCYFHSIYYREPGGVLFEIATENPGFTADEPATQLGTKLKLPPWLESERAAIEQAVTPVRLPTYRTL